MAKKADFTGREWKLLISGPQYVRLAMKTADAANPKAERTEADALDTMLADYKSRSPLVRSILADQDEVSSRIRAKKPLDKIEEIAELLEKKANDSSGDAVLKLLTDSGEALANAVKESRRLGTTAVSKNEGKMLARLHTALGLEYESESEDESDKPRRTVRGGTGVRPRRSGIKKGVTKSAKKSQAPAPVMGPQAPEKRPATRPTKPPSKPKSTRTERVAPTPKPQPPVKQKTPKVTPKRANKPKPQIQTPAAQSSAGSVTRWTNLFSKPQPGAGLDIGLAPDTIVTVTGFDALERWVAIESAEGKGWIPRDALRLSGARATAPTAAQTSPAVRTIKPTQAKSTQTRPPQVEPASNEDTLETMTISRAAPLQAGPSKRSAMITTVDAGSRIVLLSIDAGWIHVRYEGNEGWIAAEALG